MHKTDIDDLYRRFDAVFSRPTAFTNNGCCVSDADEAPLLRRPREKLTAGQMEHPLRHYHNCFGTFEQFGYFVPRLLELQAEGDDFRFWLWPSLRLDRSRYAELGLWEPLLRVIRGIFHEGTGTFEVGGRDGGWWWVDWSEEREAMLQQFFHPELSPEPAGWERFFEEWAADENPCRTAHLLDTLRETWTVEWHDAYARTGNARPRRPPDTDTPGYVPIPDGFRSRLEDDAYLLDLMLRAERAAAGPWAPLWLDALVEACAHRGKVPS